MLGILIFFLLSVPLFHHISLPSSTLWMAPCAPGWCWGAGPSFLPFPGALGICSTPLLLCGLTLGDGSQGSLIVLVGAFNNSWLRRQGTTSCDSSSIAAMKSCCASFLHCQGPPGSCWNPLLSPAQPPPEGNLGLVSIPAASPEPRDFPARSQNRTGQILPPRVP